MQYRNVWNVKRHLAVEYEEQSKRAGLGWEREVTLKQLVVDGKVLRRG